MANDISGCRLSDDDPSLKPQSRPPFIAPLGLLGCKLGLPTRGEQPEAHRVWDPELVPAYTATVYMRGGGGTGFANSSYRGRLLRLVAATTFTARGLGVCMMYRSTP